MNVTQRRQARVDEAMVLVKALCGEGDVTRDTLCRIESILLELVREKTLFPEGEFGIPAEEKIRLYRLAEDDDGGFALYLHAANSPAKVSPHNHTTWACIAGISGEERNFLYKSENGAAPVHVGTKSVRENEAISLLPTEIHSIQAIGKEPLRNLHLYGKAIDQLYNRVFWDPENEHWCTLPPTSGIIERRPQ